MLSHAEDCTETECAPGCIVADLDEQAGLRRSGTNPSRRTNNVAHTVYGTFDWEGPATVHREADAGGASRYFPTFRYASKTPPSERPKIEGVFHPTPKPLSLMTWLVDLLASPGAVVLDPFAGSGTTLEACTMRGVESIGIERHADYLALIEYRIARAQEARTESRGS